MQNVHYSETIHRTLNTLPGNEHRKNNVLRWVIHLSVLKFNLFKVLIRNHQLNLMCVCNSFMIAFDSFWYKLSELLQFIIAILNEKKRRKTTP